MKKPSIYIYNSLSKKEELLNTANEDINIYFCGPTVYADAHIGNYRPPVVFDLLHRFLTYLGLKVNIASNITDVDDKIINAAKEANISELELTTYYANRYFETLEKLNVLPLTYTPKVTETIEQIIALITTLIEKGFAYQVNGNVYFRVRLIKDFGAIANLSIDELLTGARIAVNPEKEDPLDFVLWKKTDEGINWPAPFSTGRPGWHSECVAMIQTLFNNPVTIHGGGFDLKFPHHCNELAQAQAGYQHNLAKFWMHVGFLNLNGIKMSKSEGNTITGIDAVAKYGPNIIRHLLLSSHYRLPINISEETIANATNEVNKILSALTAAQYYLLKNKCQYLTNHKITLDFEMENFVQYLCQDINISNALTVAYEVVKKIHIAIRNNVLSEVMRLENILYQIVYILGYYYQNKELEEQDLLLIAEYELARSTKDFVKSDRLRQLLSQKGII